LTVEDAVACPPCPLCRLVQLSAAIFIVQAVAGYLIYISFGRWEDRSSFGSMFGAVEPIFSGLAFAGVIYAILLQRLEELAHKIEA
jgi:hypothetical protein